MPDGHLFCGICGKRISSRGIEDLNADISDLNERFQLLTARLEKKDQTLLEWETSQKIVDRFEKWAKTLAFFTGVPIALVLLTLSLIAGKSLTSLHEIAESAQSTIQPIIEKAKREALAAKSTADYAVQSSAQVQQQISDTRGQLQALAKAAQSRATVAEQLSGQIARSQQEVDELRKKVVDQSLAVERLENTSKAVKIEQNEQKLLEMYPNYGTHYVAGATGVGIDAKQKHLGSNYISLMLPLTANAAAVMRPKLKGIAALASDLEAQGDRLFIGSLSLNARGGTSVAGILGFSGNTCGIIGGISAPCILYTSQQKKEGAFRLRKQFESIENIPPTQIKLVDISKLNPDVRELIEISGMDYFVEIKF
jgi:hypothetical protein